MSTASFKRYESSDLLGLNVEQHLDIKFLENGMYSNVASGQGWYTDSSRIDTLTRKTATVYESSFDNWVIEGDVTGPSGYAVTVASGIYVDGVFSLWGSGALAPKIDYNRGRVIFASDPGSSAVISAEFSYKRVAVTDADSSASQNVFSLYKDNVDATVHGAPSGMVNQLPLVAIDFQGRELGARQLGGGSTVDQDVVFHIVANTKQDANKIVDVLSTKSYRKVIQGVDFNDTPTLFDRYGGKAGTYADYTTLQANSSYQREKLYVEDTKVKQGPKENLGLYTARVDWTLRFYLPAGG